MKRALTWALMASLCTVVAYGCDDDGEDTDAGVDAGEETDSGPGDDTIRIDGLDGDVEVLVDDRGMPHIYGTTINDVAMVNGYMQARDRYTQMEFLRRAANGQLAEVLGVADPSLVEMDREVRFIGFRRIAQEVYDALPADDVTKVYIDSWVAGVNAYIQQVVMQPEWQPPRGLETFNFVRASAEFGLWEPADVLALGRLLAWQLSYDAGADTGRTERLLGARAAFPADGVVGTDPADPRLADRVGIYADFFSEVQARRVYTRDGFNDGTTMAVLPSTGLPVHIPELTPVPLETVRRATRFFERLDEHPFLRRDPHFGSNSWVVSGTHTASGNPILSNDPHLGLDAPGVWWYVHLNTAEMSGELDLDVQGVGFAPIAGVTLGYNRNIAWSATTTGYDVTDVYNEEVTFVNDGTAAAPEWRPVSVLFEGSQVDLTTITEMIGTGSGTDEFVIFVVPHHGNIIPDSITPPDVDPAPDTGGMATGSALSVRYTGDVPTNEIAFFRGLWTAETIDDALVAQNNFEFGAQNFSFVTADDIAWSTQSRIPQREAMACSFQITPTGEVAGVSPLFILPGQGGFEWESDLPEQFIPHDVNPARGYIANANQDNVGVTDDGNPCNDAYYIGGGFAVGYRQGRIVQRLDEATGAGGITTDDMIELQAETRSSTGEGMRDAIVASLDAAIAASTTPSSDPALQAVVDGLDTAALADITDVRDRLMAWSFETPHGVGASDATEIADSVATTIFNASWIRIANLAFRDEETRIGRGLNSAGRPRLLEWALMDSVDQDGFLYTYRADYDGITGWNDSVLWDDLDTDTVTETRDERVLSGILEALAWLEMELGADREMWRWGRLHAVRFNQTIPPASGAAQVSVPPGDSEEFPIGFPRAGDYGAVDVGNFSTSNGTRFTHGSGASQRLVVEMTPTGPNPFNALPGGQVEDPDSPHHADEAELWRMNQQPALYFERADIEANLEDTINFGPPS